MLVRTDRDLIRANAESVRHVVVDLVAPRALPRTERTPVNVALVIDRSGSMEGAKIELAKMRPSSSGRLLSHIIASHHIEQRRSTSLSRNRFWTASMISRAKFPTPRP